MTVDTDLMHASADTWRRHAILEAVVGFAVLFVALICAARGEAWHGTLAGILGGGIAVAAFMTYAKARLWERVAMTRGKAEPAPQHWPSPLATKGDA